MQWLDVFFESSARSLARRTSRRSVLAGLGSMLLGAGMVPLLPVARGAEAKPGGAAPASGADPGDPSTCEYWRHCAIDGFICGCCGGSQSLCPPGSQLPHSFVCQRGPGIALADGAVVVAVAFPAPRLESYPDVIAGGIDRRPVLRGLAAIDAGVSAGRPADFLDAVVPYVIGRACSLARASGQLVAARAGAAFVVAPD